MLLEEAMPYNCGVDHLMQSAPLLCNLQTPRTPAWLSVPLPFMPEEALS